MPTIIALGVGLDIVGKGWTNASDRPPQPHGPPLRRTLTYVIQLSAVGAIYYFIAYFSLNLALVHPSATVISPQAGFAFAAVLVWGCRVVPAIFAAAFLLYAVSSAPSYVATAIAAGNALGAFVGDFFLSSLQTSDDAETFPTGIDK